MNPRLYFVVTGLIFLVVAVLHLTRIVAGWPVVLGSWTVPQWISIPGLVVPGGLSAWGLTLASGVGKRG